MRGVYIQYSEAELEWLSEHRALVISEYQEQFNTRFSREISKKNLHALRKRKGWKTGRSGQFAKGSIPLNKGKGQHRWMGKGGLEASKKTRFKKGNISHNAHPLYYERLSKDGYIEIKVPEKHPRTGAPTRFKLKHHWIWEKNNGPVASGHIVRFIDGDKTNCNIDNLELMSRGVNAILNKRRFSDMPESIKPTAKLIAELEAKSASLAKGGDA